MKISYTKKQFLNSLSYDWWKYILLTVLLSVIWYFFFNLKNGLKDTQKVRFFTTADVKDYSIQKELKDEFFEQGIYEVKFYECSEDLSDFNTALEYQGFMNSDVIIVSESYLNAEDRNLEYFLSKTYMFTNEDLSSFTNANSSIEFYSNNEITYALKIFDKSNSTYNTNFTFSEWLDIEDETYYAFISKSSKNTTKEHHASIDSLIYLLGR